MSADEKAKRNAEKLDQAVDRLQAALNTWQDAFELLIGNDLVNDALVNELISRMDYAAQAHTRTATWLRAFAKHRMN